MKFKKAKIGIAGAGGIGSNVAVSLVRSGITDLVIADFDVIQESNLNRQFYFKSQIGEVKVKALETNLLMIDPQAKFNMNEIRLNSENIPKIFADVDIMVEAFDREDQKAMLIKTFMEMFPHKTLIAASGLAGVFSSNTIKTHSMSKHFYVVGDLEHTVSDTNPPMSPRVQIASNHIANLILELLHEKV